MDVPDPVPGRPDASALAARVKGLPARCGGTAVVAVDGPSGAGKTTFARSLADILRACGQDVGLVHVDDVFPGWDGLEAGVPRIVDGVLVPLSRGLPGRLLRWDWTADRDLPADPVPVPRVLVLEGVGSGARACAPYLSLLVWLDGPEPVRRARAIARDGAAYAPHWERWADQERRHYARERTADRADVTYSLGPVGGAH